MRAGLAALRALQAPRIYVEASAMLGAAARACATSASAAAGGASATHKPTPAASAAVAAAADSHSYPFGSDPAAAISYAPMATAPRGRSRKSAPEAGPPAPDDSVEITPTHTVLGADASPAERLAADMSMGAKPDSQTLEIKDSKLVFDMAWAKLVARVGIEKMTFPRELVFLSGAPGAGKGTMCGFIMKERDIPYVFEVSSLLKSPEMKKLKDAGRLIGDKDVIEILLNELFTKPEYANGVVIDGYPRTTLQAEVLKLLHDRLLQLYYECRDHPDLRRIVRRPQFSICVLYVDEDESVRRQLKRGKELAKLNQMVKDTGVGTHTELRATDLNEEAARRRYRIFKDEVYAALQVVKDRFHFHFISADGGPDDVRQRILHEFAYQSSQDLNEETYELVRSVEPASSVIKNARSNMVTRLNSYATDYKELLHQTLQFINTEFMHIIKRQALFGTAVIRSNNALLENGIAVNMVLDLLAERGYSVTLDIVRAQIPAYIEPQIPGDVSGARIICRVEKNFIFRIEFPRPEIRRND